VAACQRSRIRMFMLNSALGFSIAAILTATSVLACDTEKFLGSKSVGLGFPKHETTMRSGFTLCNRRSEGFSVAIGYKRDGRQWQSEGWWTAKPGQCIWLLDETEKVETVYIHAARKATGPVVTGSMSACVKDTIFTVLGAKDCSGRGLNSVGFAELRINRAKSYVYDVK
jgi:uncharacterized membrane protein